MQRSKFQQPRDWLRSVNTTLLRCALQFFEMRVSLGPLFASRPYMNSKKIAIGAEERHQMTRAGAEFGWQAVSLVLGCQQ
jgi:hypothetical protein